MLRLAQLNFDNYSRSGDVAVIGICVVMVILLMTSYVSHTRSLRIFMGMIVNLVAASIVNITYHSLLATANPGVFGAVYALRIMYHALLFDVFFLFALYTTVVSAMEHRQARTVAIVSMALFVVIVAADIVLAISGAGFRIGEDGVVRNRTNLFMIGYVLYILLLLVLMRRVRSLLFKQVMRGFYGTMAVSVLLRFGQMLLNQSSLTTMTFVFPVIAMLYIMHSNPYNVTLGAVDIRALEDMIRNLHARKTPFIFLSLFLLEYDEEGKELPEGVRAMVRKVSGDYFKNSVLFQIGNGHLILLAPKNRNPDFEQRIRNSLVTFQRLYDRYNSPYKIVIGESVNAISQRNEYTSLIKSIQSRMRENEIYRISLDDIDRFNRNEYILHELTDIYNRRDLDDPRVLAFCQPVFDLKTGQFSTAEALMRLKLEQTGLVFPDQFIPLAENHGYIHVLTEIILHKTCQEIRRLLEEGYRINRISVNVSMLELKDRDFCDDIIRIIDASGLSARKIAIELTETRNERDFLFVKEKIEQLRQQGIQFYLDDFGTGYSNMERIMELPFDIIKFDRSLVIASGTDDRSEKIVENLAHMFRDMDYSVLYEGVETQVDEARCREMSASYLQGYMFSRPIPIDRLRDFLPQLRQAS